MINVGNENEECNNKLWKVLNRKCGNAAKISAIAAGTAATANWKCSDRKSGIKNNIMKYAASKNDKCRK